MAGLESLVSQVNIGKASLSKIILGTMRWKDKGLSVQDATDLIRLAKSKGVDTHHISIVYSSYTIYREAFSNLSNQERSEIKVIAKVGFPNFREEFSESNLNRQVESYLNELNIEQLEVAQWLDRWDQLNDERDKLRIERLRQNKSFVEESFKQLQSKGWVKEFTSFPYTLEYARNLLDLGLLNSFTCYLNRAEKEYVEIIDKSSLFIAIRPFKAKELIEDTQAKDLLREVFEMGADAVIVGLNRPEQILELIEE